MAPFVSLQDAVRDVMSDGLCVALEGFTHLIPHASAHEIIRQGFKNLTLVRMTPDIIYDQMIGMGCASKLIFSYAGNPGVGLLRRLRDGQKITVGRIAGLLDCSARTIQRNMCDELKKEKELLNKQL